MLVIPINPEKCGPNFIPFLYHQGNHVLSSQIFMYCKFTWSKDATQGPGCTQHNGLGHLPRLMVALRKLRTFSLGNWAYNFKRILWVTQDTGLCQPACRRDFPFWKRTLLKLKPRCMVLQFQQTVTYQERSQCNRMGLEAQADLAAVLYWF